MSAGNRIPAVYLCGPIAEPGQPAKGGFQSCNRRTIDALASRGVEIHTLPYAQPESRGLRKAWAYLSGFAHLGLRVLLCKRGSILHLTGLYGPFIQAEIVLIHLAQLRGCRSIYDLRAGSGELHFRRRGSFYRACFRHALRSVDLVMVEGAKLMAFVESLTGRPAAIWPGGARPARNATRGPILRQEPAALSWHSTAHSQSSRAGDNGPHRRPPIQFADAPPPGFAPAPAPGQRRP